MKHDCAKAFVIVQLCGCFYQIAELPHAQYTRTLVWSVCSSSGGRPGLTSTLCLEFPVLFWFGFFFLGANISHARF